MTRIERRDWDAFNLRFDTEYTEYGCGEGI